MVLYFYWNTTQQCPYYSYAFYVVRLIGIIEYIKHYFVSLQRRMFYMETYLLVIVAGDINVPQKRFCATVNVFV
jgi:hypothetical protein